MQTLRIDKTRQDKTRHISLGICVSWVGKQISLGICVPQVGGYVSAGFKRISLGIFFPVGDHISLGICDFQPGKQIFKSSV